MEKEEWELREEKEQGESIEGDGKWEREGKKETEYLQTKKKALIKWKRIKERKKH